MSECAGLGSRLRALESVSGGGGGGSVSGCCPPSLFEENQLVVYSEDVAPLLGIVGPDDRVHFARGTSGVLDVRVTNPVSVSGVVPVSFDQPIEVEFAPGSTVELSGVATVSGGVEIISPIGVSGIVVVDTQDNIRTKILASPDRTQLITFADFGTINQRVIQIDYHSTSVYPLFTARKTMSYTLVGLRYRRDSIVWQII